MINKETVLAYIKNSVPTPQTEEVLAEALGVTDDERKEFAKILAGFVLDGAIVKTKRKRYCSMEKMGYACGSFISNRAGFGFVVPDGVTGNDIFIQKSRVAGAMHGDRVIVQIIKRSHDGKRKEGSVIKIISRNVTQIVGTLIKSGNLHFVTPDDQKISSDIFIAKSGVNGAKKGQKVVVKIIHYGDATRAAQGEIVEVVGYDYEVGADILSIIRQFEIKDKFDNAVEAECENISEQIPEKDYKDRLDLRSQQIITIDGDDAKDLDDAVNVEPLPNGGYRLGVHIADVSHYVKEGSALDAEALERGTSVYLVDRVIPMLPTKLSNGICSLNPNVDRLTMSAIMEFDQKGKLTKYSLHNSVIKTTYRMTYDDVTAILEGDKPLCKKYDKIVEQLSHMRDLAKILKEKRVKRGSIDFDFPEPKIVCDETGAPIEIKKYRISISNKIIEEFMLACNETVAKHIYKTEKPWVYRIHEQPREAKVANFIKLAATLGYKLKGHKPGTDVTPKMLQQVLSQCAGKPEQRVISTVMLRSLMRATYSTENMGHFGLAAEYYCHFTSPIRRYPDLIVHRLLKEYIRGRVSTMRLATIAIMAERAAEQSSKREVRATEAEREVDKVKMVQYMSKYVGESFCGIISSVTSFGFFVELDNMVEGLVRMEALRDDYYIFDEANLQLTGERKKKVYRIGDTINITVTRADVAAKQIDFCLADLEDKGDK